MTVKPICTVLILIMTVMGAVAALFLKKASGIKSFKKFTKSPDLYLGGGIYFLAALINVYVLNYLDYSVVLPLTSITYIWTMVISGLVLKEKITVRKIIGVVCILAGALIISVM